MRDGLQKQSNYVYGLNKADFEYTLRLTKDMINASRQVIEQKKNKIEKENPEMVDDIMDDYIYYNYIDIQYMWHFCLWRLQAIFEGIIVTRFLSHNDKKLFGLKTKLEAMKREGYTLSSKHYNEITEWSELRNNLSHQPPEQYRPIFMEKEDILEYIELLKCIIEIWENEEKEIKQA